MVSDVRQGLVARHTLTAQEMAEVEELSATCNAHEHLLMRLDYNLLTGAVLPTRDLFLWYRADRLVGCLLLDRYHQSEMKEVTGMVLPELRRQGIFGQLLTAARTECLSRGIRRLLFPCEDTSLSGLAFLHAIGAEHEASEHRMLLQKFQPRYQFDDHLLVREAQSTDIEKLAIVLASDFDDSQEQAYQHIMRVWARPNQRFYIATYGSEDVGCAEPVGSLRVEDMPQESGIYGFVVRSEYRRRGHGRQIMEETILTLREQGKKPIMLEVDTTNLNALNLYLSLGFEIERTYGYYGVNLE